MEWCGCGLLRDGVVGMGVVVVGNIAVLVGLLILLYCWDWLVPLLGLLGCCCLVGAVLVGVVVASPEA